MKTKSKKPYVIKNLDELTRGYIHAALWSTNDESDESGGEPFDRNYSESDIAPKSRRAMRAQCAKFLRACGKDLYEYVTHVHYNPNEGSPWDYAGHDFWLTANGHGAGFWDREGIDKDLGKRLSLCAKKYGGGNLYVGDDGAVYFSGAE